MNLISVSDLTKTVQDEPLIEGVSLGIDSGEKIGFIGPNGSGKSTFLKVISGLADRDSGEVSVKNDLNISFLPQNPEIPEGIKLKDFLYLDSSSLMQLVNEYQMKLKSYDHSPSGERKLTSLMELMDHRGAWEIENSYLSFLGELNLPDPEREMDSLSGGERKRAAIARCLAVNPDLLLLDEPTNHLDIETIEWLEKFLASKVETFLMVTHDRYFLDRVCTSIMEIDNRKIYKYKGSYSTFLERKQERLKEEQNRQIRIQAILRRELEWLKRGPRARAGKDKKRKMRIQNLMEEKTAKEHESAEFSSSNRRLGKKILDLKKVEVSFGGKKIIAPFSYSFKKGERIGIVGPNGSGKSTFLNIISGKTVPDSGEVDPGINTRTGYYDQLSSPLKEDETPLGFIEKRAPRIKLSDGGDVSASGFLEMFNFPVSVQRNLISTLSGGEKRRLYLISVLAENPNFLLLDEPTNDLDVDTMTKLEDYITGFRGTILTVSHDRAFLDRTCDYLFIFSGDGSISGFFGNYTMYREEAAGKAERPSEPVKSGQKKKQDREKKTLSFKENREFETLMEEIESLEEKKDLLEKSFTDTSLSHSEIAENGREYEKLTVLIKEKSKRWEELAEFF